MDPASVRVERAAALTGDVSVPAMRARRRFCGGGGNRTRVPRRLRRPSPSAAGSGLSGAAPLPAPAPPRTRRRCPWPPVGTAVQVSPTGWRPYPARRAGTGRTSRRLGREREL